MNLIGKYKNGNYTVMLFEDGTKVRYNDLDNLTPSFAESMDVKLTDKCSVGCPFCLIEDTIINTVNGKKKIKDIVVNDKVYSFNEKNNEFEIQDVIETYKHQYTGEIITIELNDGNKIVCTPNHKIFTSNRGYIEAKDINETDDILIYE